MNPLNTTSVILIAVILVIAAVIAFYLISIPEEPIEYFQCMLHIDYHYPEWYQNSTLTLNILMTTEPIPNGDGDTQACSGVLLNGQGSYIGATLTNTNNGNLIWGKEFPREDIAYDPGHDWIEGFTCKPPAS